MRNRALFREDDNSVVKLNPNWMEGLAQTAKTNQTLLAIQYAARLINDLLARVEELEAQVTPVEGVAASGPDLDLTNSGATKIADPTVADPTPVVKAPAKRAAKKVMPEAHGNEEL